MGAATGGVFRVSERNEQEEFMKNKIQKILAIVIALALLIGFAGVLMMYSKPMKDVSLNPLLVP
jgi:hypothetical protein